MSNKGRFFTGAILGAAIGGATAMLFCTKNGRKLKDKIMKNIDFHDLLDLSASAPAISRVKHSLKKKTSKKSKRS